MQVRFMSRGAIVLTPENEAERILLEDIDGLNYKHHGASHTNGTLTGISIWFEVGEKEPRRGAAGDEK